MPITRNEFLKLIVDAHISALDEMGSMGFWVDQHIMWVHGIRDGRIHDTTAKVMIAWENVEAAERIDNTRWCADWDYTPSDDEDGLCQYNDDGGW